MHTLLTHLQKATIEQQPSIASLLLQLDLLVRLDPMIAGMRKSFSSCKLIGNSASCQVEPRKMSIYREESIDALFEAFCRKDNYNVQTAAADALLHLSGRLTSSGKCYAKSWLLKLAGFDQPYNALMKDEGLRKPDSELSEREVCIYKTS